MTPITVATVAVTSTTKTAVHVTLTYSCGIGRCDTNSHDTNMCEIHSCDIGINVTPKIVTPVAVTPTAMTPTFISDIFWITTLNPVQSDNSYNKHDCRSDIKGRAVNCLYHGTSSLILISRLHTACYDVLMKQHNTALSRQDHLYLIYTSYTPASNRRGLVFTAFIYRFSGRF